ncbi:hypothetical protein SAMN05216268_13612 [Streptomyces yunnanensis]|uniref:Uncharacterized protein n=1 Tax=Streptomyces yunnanensis TaxID=156453 RepID=A0A9X8N986_9ACTN|nr:hypothetical protein SAMN05216268_13612 [Streptomyces yunnanensis]
MPALTGLLSDAEDVHEGDVLVVDGVVRSDPGGRQAAGVVVNVVSLSSSLCRVCLGDGEAGGGLVHDALLVGERGDEGLQGDVVD